ncbi:UDP-N-acetylmuramate--L-alanine ligase [hydrothermal vent metagenome]|uniref:UDP-N-acetylmuramate--L-alanine ligase n=1 Tax=hydrothermal vent metagenome TaxID=652676 RepID=A0A3B1D624_9ZZZZ
MFEQFRVIHFVGIGGIGMSGIAEVLRNLGYEVTGSDVRESDNTRRLREMGIKVYIGHRPENVDSAHVVVISSAVRDDNIEVLEARLKSIPVIPRAEMLAELGRLKYSILVAGAHGKTTTTSLISAIVSGAGLDPTVVIGGRLKATGSNARLGQGDFLIAEADESDGSFLKLSPTIALATNIDREHMDYFGSMEVLCNAFREFLDKVPFYGISILSTENAYLRRIMGELQRKYITFGFSPEADIRACDVGAEGLGMRFRVVDRGVELGEFRIPLVGVHNVLNALSAICVASELRIDVDMVRETLAGFSGIQRRFEFKGEFSGAKVYDDYGHHPTEIRATLGSVCRAVNGRFVVVFQPHRYSRTKELMREFVDSFEGVDVLYLMDIYPAGEKPINGVSSELLYREMKGRVRDIRYIRGRDDMVADIGKELKVGDLLLTLGAGDVWKVGEEILNSSRR